MTKKIVSCFLILALALLAAIPAAQAGAPRVAVAANYTLAAKNIAALYKAETGIEPELCFGSTGMLYGQITNGAPYDLFLAADTKRPNLLFDAGQALAPVVYAKGKIALWSTDKDLAKAKDWTDAVKALKGRPLGMANPTVAPYGAMAMQALQAAIPEAIPTLRITQGKNVSQAFQFAHSGNAAASFVSLSQALSPKGSAGHYWKIPQAGLVTQGACILKNGDTKAAKAFLDFLLGAQAAKVKEKFGYE